MEAETKDSSKFENKNDIKHNVASSAMEDELFAMHFTVLFTTDPGFKRPPLLCFKVVSTTDPGFNKSY
jgi:hypothetical protein